MARLLFAGDVHGDAKHLTTLFRRAESEGVDAIWCCGDFGFWPHTGHGHEFLRLAQKLAKETGIPVYWVDGNHENHDCLDQMRKNNPGKTEIWTPVWAHQKWNHVLNRPSRDYNYGETSPHVLWVPRGSVLEFDGTRIMGFGGGFSVDWSWRQPGRSWWPQEVVTKEQIAAVPDNTKVDILVTHESPTGAILSYKDEIPDSVAQRQLVKLLVDRVKPQRVFCGHHHIRQTFHTFDGVRVDILDMNGMGRASYHIVDTADGKVDDLTYSYIDDDEYFDQPSLNDEVLAQIKKKWLRGQNKEVGS